VVTTAERTAGRTTRFAAVRAARVPVPEAVVFLVALVCRAGVVFRDGGLHGSYGYDGPVYFAAADAFIHGRTPYQDFVLLHPPGMMLALTPFAALARAGSDNTAFAAANLTFIALSAVNAVLVVQVCRRLGLTATAAVIGGLFYATWFGSIAAEYEARLEPLGNTCLLAALLFLLHARAATSRLWPAVATGVALGAAVSVKIWWVVPAVVLTTWFAWSTRDRRRTLALVGGIAAAFAVIDLPFFVAAPHAMWTSVIVEQVGRQTATTSRVNRIGDLTAVFHLQGHVSHAVLIVVAALFLVFMSGAVVASWSVRSTRWLTALLVLQVAVLLVSPSYFDHYNDYVTIAAAVVVAAAAHRLSQPRRRSTDAGPGRAAAWLPTVAAAAVTAAIFATDASAVRPLPGAHRLAAAVAHLHCVMSDTPMTLIELDALSRDLAHGCRNWVDVTGRTYGPDRIRAARVSRPDNQLWQRDLLAYLRSGNAIIIGRAAGSGINAHTRQEIARDGVLRRAGGQTVYRVAGR
jgi:alpha-1,2-mannosyltransferase